MRNVFLGLLIWVTTLLVTPYTLAQDSPPTEISPEIDNYCTAILEVWELNNSVLLQKIALLDSLSQMPDEFRAAEQALNDSLRVWHDQIMEENEFTAQLHLDFGKDSKDEINRYLDQTGQQEQLNSLRQLQDERYALYLERRQGYGIDPQYDGDQPAPTKPKKTNQADQRGGGSESPK